MADDREREIQAAQAWAERRRKASEALAPLVDLLAGSRGPMSIKLSVIEKQALLASIADSAQYPALLVSSLQQDAELAAIERAKTLFERGDGRTPQLAAAAIQSLGWTRHGSIERNCEFARSYLDAIAPQTGFDSFIFTDFTKLATGASVEQCRVRVTGLPLTTRDAVEKIGALYGLKPSSACDALLEVRGQAKADLAEGDSSPTTQKFAAMKIPQKP